MATFIPEFIPVYPSLFKIGGVTDLDVHIFGIVRFYEKMKEGKCIVSNKTIADILSLKSSKSVTASLSRMEGLGLIKVTFRDEKKRNRDEIITLFDPIHVPLENGTSETDVPLANAVVPLADGTRTAGQWTEEKENYKRTIRDGENDSSQEEVRETAVGELDVKWGSTPSKRIMRMYSEFWFVKNRVHYRELSWGKTSVMVKNLLKNYNEVQLTALIACMFNWYGADGSSQKDHEFIEKAGFPLGMLFSQGNKYQAFLVNFEKVNFDDATSLKAYIVQRLKSS